VIRRAVCHPEAPRDRHDPSAATVIAAPRPGEAVAV